MKAAVVLTAMLAATATLKAEDVLNVTGDIAIPSEGATYDRVVAGNHAVISGGLLTIRSGGSFEMSGSTWWDVKVSCPVRMGEGDSKSSQITIAPSQASRFQFSGVVSGPEDICISASGAMATVEFHGGNTFDGDVVVDRGHLLAVGDSALGSTVGVTTCDGSVGGSDRLLTCQNMATSEILYIGDEWNQHFRLLGKNTFDGKIYILGGWQNWTFEAGSETWFNGGIELAEGASGSFVGNANAGSRAGGDIPVIHWNSKVVTSDMWYFEGGDNYVSYPIQPATWASWTARGGINTSRWILSCADAIGNGGMPLLQESEDEVEYVINGIDQSVPYMDHYPESRTDKAAVINAPGLNFSSTSGNSLHLTAGGKTDQRFFGKFSGDVGLVLDGVGAAVILGGQSTSTGLLKANNGNQIEFAPTDAFPSDTGSWAGDIEIAGGTIIRVNSSASLSKAGTISISGEARLALADGVAATCGELYLDGKKVAGGTWGAPGNALADNHTELISGNGVLTSVQSTELVITESTVLPDGGVTVDRIIFSASEPITVSGGPIRIQGGDNAMIENEGANVSVSCRVELGTADSKVGVVKISVLSGKSLALLGNVAGVEDIEKIGGGDLELRGDDNSFSGDLTVVEGSVRAYSDSAFGSTVGRTICNNNLVGRPKVYLCGITTGENFTLTNDGNSNGEVLHLIGTNVINGTITTDGRFQDWYGEYKSCLTVNGAVSGSGGTWGWGENVDRSVFRWNGGFTGTGNWYFFGGTHYLASRIDLNGAGFRARGGNIHIVADGVFPSGAYLCQESEEAVTYYLDGHDLELSYITLGHGETSEDRNWETFTVASGSGNVVKLVGTEKSIVTAKFTGDAGLWVVGGQQAILTRASDSTGELKIGNGSTVFMSPYTEYYDKRAGWNGTVTVGNGTLNISSTSSLGGDARIHLGEGGVIDIPEGVDLHVSEIWIGDVKRTDRVTASNSDGHVTGGGSISGITTLEITGDYVVDAAGEEYDYVSVTGEAQVSGGKLTVRGQEFSIGADVTFGNALEFSADAIKISVGEGVVANFEGVVSGAADITKLLPGTLNLKADNTFTGSFVSSCGDVGVYADAALGTAEQGSSFANGHVLFGGVETSEPITCGEAPEDGYSSLVLPANTSNVFNGTITFVGNKGWVDRFPNQHAVFNGGVHLGFGSWTDLTFNNSATGPQSEAERSTWTFNCDVSSVDATITYKTISPLYSYSYFNSPHMAFRGNIAIWSHTGNQGQIYVCGSDFAFNYTSSLLLGVNETTEGYESAVFDLNGHDQGFLEAYYPGAAVAAGNTVTSCTEAVIRARQGGEKSVYWTFAGAAGYVYEGDGRTTLMTSSRSKGVIGATSGTLALGDDCSWSKCVRVLAGGTGTVSLGARSSLGTRSVIDISDSGVIDIPQGRSVEVGEVRLNGVTLPLGDYGSNVSGLPEDVRSHFAGGGVLNARGVKRGLAVIVR